MRTASALLLVLLAAPAAFADVVILKENDIPIMGRILAENDTSITFQIRGLGDGARMEIEKSRIRRFWREENSYFEYLKSEQDRRGTLDRLRPAEPAAEPAAPPPPPPRGRSVTEIRHELVTKAWNRFRAFMPTSILPRAVAVLGSVVFFAFLFRAGARLAGVRKLALPQAAALSLLSHLLVVVAIAAPRTILNPSYLPALVTAEVLVWLFFVKLLSGAQVSRAFLLLSFCIGSLLLLGGSVFSVLTVV